jgi:hypothetical protein
MFSFLFTRKFFNNKPIYNKSVYNNLIYEPNKSFITYLPDFHQTISNTGLPICNKCLYYKSDTKQCLKFGSMNLLTGVIDYSSAETNRSSNPCGVKGLHFTKKHINNISVLEDLWYPNT